MEETKKVGQGMAVTLRKMKATEVDAVFDLIDPEGWNLTHEKLTLLYEEKPDAFYVLVNQEDDIVATYSLNPTFKDEYILGNIVVKSSARGQGLGRRILYEFAQTTPYSAISLTSVPQALDFYLKVGMQMSLPKQGHFICHIEVDPKVLEAKLSQYKSQLDNIRFVPFDESRLPDLIKYDNSCRTYDNTPHTKVVAKCCNVVIAEESSTRCIVGYAAPFIQRSEIVFDGVFADSDAIAVAMFSESLKQFPDILKVKIQTFLSNQLLAQLGKITDSYEYQRFAFGQPTTVPETKVYCVSDCDYTM